MTISLRSVGLNLDEVVVDGTAAGRIAKRGEHAFDAYDTNGRRLAAGCVTVDAALAAVIPATEQLTPEALAISAAIERAEDRVAQARVDRDVFADAHRVRREEIARLEAELAEAREDLAGTAAHLQRAEAELDDAETELALGVGVDA